MTESESGVLPLHYTSIFSWQSGFALLNNISIFGRGCQEEMRISQQKIRIIAAATIRCVGKWQILCAWMRLLAQRLA